MSARFRLVFLQNAVQISALILIFSSSSLAATVRADFFVSLQGNDKWSGSLNKPNKAKTDGPFRTISQAIKAVREKKQSLKDGGKVSVLVRGGTYYLDSPIVFTPDDSGTEKTSIHYAAYPGEQVTLSGGYQITGWRGRRSNIWEVQLPEAGYGGSSWNFRSLFVDGRRTHRARLPKSGYFFAAARVEPSEVSKEKGFDRLKFNPSDIRAEYHNRDDIEVVVFHRWVNSRLHIKSIDTVENVVNFDGATPGISRFYEITKGTRYRLANVKEAVTSPGDWYFDRKTRVLTYKAAVGQNPNTRKFIAPRLPFLVQVKGAKNIEFSGFVFAHTHWEAPSSAFIERQSADNIGESAFQLLEASEIRVHDCKFIAVDGYAVEIGAGSTKNVISSNTFRDLGSGGIKIDGSKDHPTSRNVIENNLISNGGRVYPTGAGILLKSSDSNIVRHNEVSDFYYTGISVGWNWGYGDSSARDNQILFNKVYKIGQGVMSDLGGIYTLGVSGKTLIEGNVIYDVESFQEHNGWGIYFDEGSQDVLAKNNLVYRTRSGGFHQHYGKNNTVANNIFAFSRYAQIQRTRDEPHQSFSFTHNIVYWDGDKPLLRKNWFGSGYEFDYNIYWNGSPGDTKFPNPDTKKDNYSDLNLSFVDWQKRGQDVHSRFVDPMFVNASKNDFRLKYNSPAARFGFKPFDYSKAGRIHVRN